MQKIKCFFIFIIIICHSGFSAYSQLNVVLPKGHSHNDYLQKRPLFDALELGFRSIEIDVYALNDRLVVSHLPIFLHSKPDIESLYFFPLNEYLKDSAQRAPFVQSPLTLMIDLKGNGEEALTLLMKKIEVLRPHIIYPNQMNHTNGVIKILLSGSKPMEMIQADPNPFYSIDRSIRGGLFPDSGAVITLRLSDPMKKHFISRKKIKESEIPILNQMVWKAHALGKEIRFYATANRTKLWMQLHRADVDWINVDKLKKYAEWVSKSAK